MDRLDAWRLFTRVAETGAFSRAAAEVGVSQPAASRAISDLEARYGARLLNRTTRRVTLTEAGERAYRRALVLIEEAETLEAEVRDADREPVGLLRISASVAHARAEIAPHAGAFLAQYPRMRLDFATNDGRIDLIAEGVDLAFRLGAMEDSTLTARRLGAYQRMLVAAPGLLAKIGVLKSPLALAGAPCVLSTNMLSPRVWTLSNNDRVERVEVEGQVRASTGRVVRDFAVQGLGIAMTPCFLVRRDLESGALVRVLPEWSGEPMPLNAVWASGRNLPRKARVFLDFITPKLTAG